MKQANHFVEYLLTEFLFVNKKLNLPFIGVLQIKSLPAFFNREEKTFLPTSYVLEFQHSPTTMNDPLLFEYLNNKLGDDRLSISSLLNFVQSLFEQVKNQTFVWKNIGEFSMGEQKQIVFQPNFKIGNFTNETFKTLFVNSVVQKKVEEGEEMTTQSLIKKTVIHKEEGINVYVENPVARDKRVQEKDNSNTPPDLEIMKDNVVDLMDDVFKNMEVDAVNYKPVTEEAFKMNELGAIDINLQQSQVLDFDKPKHYRLGSKIEKDFNKHVGVKTEFLDTNLAEKYSTFQKIFIITLLVITVIYLFFHLFLNDFSFHSYSN